MLAQWFATAAFPVRLSKDKAICISVRGMRAATAQLVICLTCLFLFEHTLLATHGSQLRLQTTKYHAAAVRRRKARHTAALQQASAHSLPGMPGSRTPGVSAEDFLAACNFTTAEVPGNRTKWFMGRSACRILGKLDRLVFVGDSLTRQVQSAHAPGGDGFSSIVSSRHKAS